jgi:hypothetical protein
LQNIGAGSGAQLNSLFCFDYKKDRLEKTGKSGRVMEKLEKCFGFGRKGIETEIKKRTELLVRLRGEKNNLKDFFEKVNNYE